MANAFHVHLECWVEDKPHGEQFIEKAHHSFYVQPPAWCHNDLPELKLHLEHLGKLQFLYMLRRTGTLRIDADHQYLIKANLKGWDTPPNYKGDRSTVVL